MGMSEEWTRDTTMGEGRMPGGGRMVRDSSPQAHSLSRPPAGEEHIISTTIRTVG